MIRLRKYIAFLLFGIFFFPILFQSVHIVWHHSHSYKCDHNHYHQTIIDIHLHPNNVDVSEKEKTCPICEYQFPINDLPKAQFFRSIVPVIACIYNKIANQQQYKAVFSNKTPRAPPLPIF